MANDYPVTSRQIDLLALVSKLEGKNLKKPPIAYEFASARKFDDTTEQGGSFYQPE